jgi:hypothetical protein
MSAALELAVRASLGWYEEIFAVHEIPTRTEDGLWSSLGDPPRWHSAAKTLSPEVSVDRVLRAVEAFDDCSVADSYGALDLAEAGFRPLFEAQWLFRPPPATPSRSRPEGWSVVSDEGDLSAWNAAHDTTGVLIPPLLGRPASTILMRRSGQDPVGGAVLHQVGDVVEVSNVWATGDEGRHVASVVDCAAALFPHRALTGYAHGSELRLFERLGFRLLGPQVVWARQGGSTRARPPGRSRSGRGRLGRG